MRILSFLVLFINYMHVLNAQTDKSKGLHFEKELCWNKILEKAKRENKYIFIDCFTTWCGPCRLMEKEVYSDPVVGSYFNDHFVSIKLQMDKTEKDDVIVKNWYEQADVLSRNYGIPEYPTYLFLSPGGELVARDKGYKNINDFLDVAHKSIESNPQAYMTYYKKLSEYEKGKKDYNNMPALMDTAMMLGQGELEGRISLDYKNYLLIAGDEKIWSKVNIAFLAAHLGGSKDPIFAVFYLHENRIDSVMGINGYAAFVVDNIIQQEEIHPVVLKYQDSLNNIVSSPFHKEPRWDDLEKLIQDKYSKPYGERNIYKSQVKWYQDHHEWSKCAQFLTLLGSKYSMDANNTEADSYFMFAIWWSIFDRSVDKEQIDLAIETMKGIVTRILQRGDAPFCFLDTYANLLYKSGKVEKAIQQETQALNEAVKWKQPEGDIKEYRETINKMKMNIPTWPRYIDKDDILGNGLI